MIKNCALWLIGAGEMAQDYAKIIRSMNIPFEVIGNGEKSAVIFENNIGCLVKRGGVEKYLNQNKPPEEAIIAVGILELYSVAKTLIISGVKRILLEKPGGINLSELENLNKLAKEYNAEIYIAYNRRFYNSVEMLREIIKNDGGVLSFNFEFTEWAHKIGPLPKAKEIKEKWLFANSTHVLDLAFHLCGKPVDWKSWHRGELEWHPSGARFCGAGLTEKGIMFTYSSDWQAPGRWGLEFMTAFNRLILRPMEELSIIKTGEINKQDISLTSDLDIKFKPGLYRQLEAFFLKNDEYICTLNEQLINSKIYFKMAGYN